MTTIDLPRHSVVLILGHRRNGNLLSAMADLVPAASCPWNVQKPDDSLAALHEMLAREDRVRVVMPNSNAKARRAVSSAARKRGAMPIALRLPGAEAVGEDERYDRVVEVDRVEDVLFRVVPMPCDLSHVGGPFDFIGDVHGCREELTMLLDRLGHLDPATGRPRPHPEGRVPVLLGDLTDRGPENIATLRLVREMESVGALRILGNHDVKLARWLQGKEVLVAAGLAVTIAEAEALDVEERLELAEWLMEAQTHLILDGGRVVAAHAGIDERNQERHTSGARSFALYGKPTGDLDEEGHPIAEDWAMDYAGEAVVVHGHVVHEKPRILNGVVALDTGCVFGGSLTAFRWPEREFTSVPALREHWTKGDAGIG